MGRRQPENVTPILLTPEQAAVRLGIGRTRVYELLKRRELGHVRIGRSRRIPIDEVDALAQRWREEQGTLIERLVG